MENIKGKLNNVTGKIRSKFSSTTKEEIKDNIEQKINQVKHSVDTTVPKLSRFPLQLQLEEIRSESAVDPETVRDYIKQKNQPKTYKVKVKCVLDDDEKHEIKEKLLYMRWYFFIHVPKKAVKKVKSMLSLNTDIEEQVKNKPKMNLKDRFRQMVTFKSEEEVIKGNRTSNKSKFKEESLFDRLNLKPKKKKKTFKDFLKKCSPTNILANLLSNIVKAVFIVLWKSGIITFALVIFGVSYYYKTNISNPYVAGFSMDKYVDAAENFATLEPVNPLFDMVGELIQKFFGFLMNMNLGFLANNTFLYILIGFIAYKFAIKGIKKAKPSLIIVPVLILLTVVITTLL